MAPPNMIRTLLGGGAFYDVARLALPPPLMGADYPDSQYQVFVDEIAKANGISRRILVRETDSHLNGKVTVRSIGNLFVGQSQILIPKDTPLSRGCLKFACAHELGRLVHHHSLIITALAIVNIVLGALPMIPIPIFLTTCAVSAISFIPLVRAADAQADDFALKNCPLNVIEEFTRDLAEDCANHSHRNLSKRASFMRYLSSCEDRLAKCEQILVENSEIDSAVE